MKCWNWFDPKHQSPDRVTIWFVLDGDGLDVGTAT
jgi:hypothetical protein